MKGIVRTSRSFALLSAISLGFAVLATMVAVFSLGPSSSRLNEVVPVFAGVASSIVGFYFAASRENRHGKLQQRQVFIVHSSDDLEKARLLAEAVRKAGYSAWLDADQVTPGESIAREVDKAIRKSALALYLAPSGSPSSYVQHELRQLALEVTPVHRRTSPVVPVLDGEGGRTSIPDWLSDVAPLSLSDPEWRTKLARTLDAAFANPDSRT